MIKYMKEEPLIRKIIIIVLTIIILMYLSFGIFQVIQLNTIHKNQIKTFQRLVGTIISEYPEKESEIINTIFQEKDNEVQKVGLDILEKYGYKLEIDMLNDNTFISYRNELIKVNIIILAILLIINIAIIMTVSSKLFSYLNKVIDRLNKFIKGDYRDCGYNLEEGIIAKVSNQLNKLGSSVALKQDRLIEEKESAKALVTDISHQLKTPLASLNMCNSILLEDDLSYEERREFLNSSEKNIKKLEYLVDSLVNISRLEAEMIKITPINSSIKETITKAISSVYVKALDKKIDIELEEFEDKIIPHDEKWTEEAIFNVLENGVKYTKEGGKIEVSLTETVNFIRISIKDNGIGIKKEEYNNIFKRFYRSKSNEVKNVEGSGVGLYLSRKIIEEQGGSISVKSKEGLGSEFIILMMKKN